MRTYLDDVKLPDAHGDLNTALSHARDRAAQAGRIIVDVLLDGIRIDSDQFDDLAHADLTGCELRLVSAEPARLVLEAWDGAREAIQGLSQLHEQVAERIDTGRIAEALEMLQEALDGWEQVRRTVEDGCALSGLDLDAVRADNDDADRAIHDLAQRLRDVREAVRGGDWVALGDSLRYDMEETASRWMGLLEELSARLRRRPEKAQ